MLSELVKETLFRVCDRTEVSQVVLCIHQPLLEVVQLLLEGLGLFNDNQTLNSTSLTPHRLQVSTTSKLNKGHQLIHEQIVSHQRDYQEIYAQRRQESG